MSRTIARLTEAQQDLLLHLHNGDGHIEVGQRIRFHSACGSQEFGVRVATLVALMNLSLIHANQHSQQYGRYTLTARGHAVAETL